MDNKNYREMDITKISLIILSLIILIPEIASSQETITSLDGKIINFTTPDTSLKLYSLNHHNFGAENGELIELRALSPTAKPFIGWYSFDEYSNKYMATGWFGCHYNLTNGDRHSHCSLETLDNVTGKPTINTKFEITYGSNLTRNDTGLYAMFSSLDAVKFGNGVDIWMNNGIIQNLREIDLYPNNQRAVGLRILKNRNNLGLQALGTDTFEFFDNILVNEVILKPSINQACNKANEGAIYYDNSTKKHYGCNGTLWNAFY